MSAAGPSWRTRASPTWRRRPPRSRGREIARRAPQMAATMASYLDQLAVSARPARWRRRPRPAALRRSGDHGRPVVRSVAAIERRHVEDFKTWQAARPGRGGKPLVDHHDPAPARASCAPSSSGSSNTATTTPRPGCPSSRATSQPSTSRCPSSWTTRRRPSSWPHWPPIPTRAGGSWSSCWPAPACGSGELAALEDDAMVRIGDTHWLRIPVGKLHNDRYVPLHPDPRRPHRRLPGPTRTDPLGPSGRTRRRQALRPAHHPPLRRSGRQARRRRPRPPPPAAPHPGHPGHQPGHEPRGHRRAARPPVDGHDARLRPDLGPHRGRRVLQGDRGRRGQLRTRASPLPADVGGPNMRKLAADHRRLLGNGHCTRPNRSTAPSRRRASGAASSRPVRSSSRSCGASGSLGGTGQDDRTELFDDLVRQSRRPRDVLRWSSAQARWITCVTAVRCDTSGGAGRRARWGDYTNLGWPRRSLRRWGVRLSRLQRTTWWRF